MKTLLTPNLIKFTVATAVLTIVFRFGLSTAIANKLNLAVALCAIIYGLLMWFNGRYFGVKEHDYLPIYDVGFRFHLATFITHNVVSVLWFVFGLHSKYETLTVIYITALIWSVFLLIHAIYFLSVRKKGIKNLDKRDLFE